MKTQPKSKVKWQPLFKFLLNNANWDNLSEYEIIQILKSARMFDAQMEKILKAINISDPTKT